MAGAGKVAQVVTMTVAEVVAVNHIVEHFLDRPLSPNESSALKGAFQRARSAQNPLEVMAGHLCRGRCSE